MPTSPDAQPSEGPGSTPSGARKHLEVCREFHEAVELFGRRWSGAIVWVLLNRPHHFAELRQAIPGLSDRLLSRRLRELEAEGVVEREVKPGTPARVLYSLSEKGRAVGPALRELESWGRRWNGGSGSH